MSAWYLLGMFDKPLDALFLTPFSEPTSSQNLTATSAAYQPHVDHSVIHVTKHMKSMLSSVPELSIFANGNIFQILGALVCDASHVAREIRHSRILW